MHNLPLWTITRNATFCLFETKSCIRRNCHIVRALKTIMARIRLISTVGHTYAHAHILGCKMRHSLMYGKTIIVI